MHLIGFTGTQAGMSLEQRTAFKRIMCGFAMPVEFHHGDCIGADAEAHDIVRPIDLSRIILHPPTNQAKRAFKDADGSMPPLPYLERNHAIVDAVGLVIATPYEKEEQLRSGTWATIRYTRKMRSYRSALRLRIIFPDGTVYNE